MGKEKKGTLGIIGFWAFIIGLIIAVVAGLGWPGNETIIVILAILGIVIGFLNITAKEFKLFLLAVVALIVAGNAFAAIGVIGDMAGYVLENIVTLMAPAAIIAAIKALWAVGRPGD